MSIVYLSLSFLARGKQSAVAVVPIGPHCLEGQPGCYLSFRFYIPSNTSLPSEQKWTVCVCIAINCHTGTPKEPPGALLLILKRQRCLWLYQTLSNHPFQEGFTQECLLCRGVAEQGTLAFTLGRGEGPGLEQGDQVETKCAKNLCAGWSEPHCVDGEGGRQSWRPGVDHKGGARHTVGCFTFSSFTFLSDPGVPGPIYGSSCLSQTHTPFWNFTDVTLADEDTNSILRGGIL